MLTSRYALCAAAGEVLIIFVCNISQSLLCQPVISDVSDEE